MRRRLSDSDMGEEGGASMLRRSRSNSPPPASTSSAHSSSLPAFATPSRAVAPPAASTGARQDQEEGRDENGIRVFCRIRPPNALELEMHDGMAVQWEAEDEFQDWAPGDVVLHMPGEGQRPKRSYHYNFSDVFPPHSTQDDVYDAVGRPLIKDVLRGLNCSVIAYGQTGSGKTFTMQGPGFDDPRTLDSGLNQSLRGVIPRTLEDLFQQLDERRSQSESYNYSVTMSFVEIYMECVVDLLVEPPANEREARSRKHHVQKGRDGSITIRDVREEPVQDAAEMQRLIVSGGRNRVTASHRMNHESSRSHAIVIVSVAQALPGETLLSQLYLVDLAGSEAVQKTNATGVRLREAQKINQSLLALGKTIFALAHDSKRRGGPGGAASHITYRDSKLTRLLENSLGGNARTAVLIACSPAAYNAKETRSSMRFGMRARTIENKVTVNTRRSADELEGLLRRSEREVAAQARYIQQLEARVQSLLLPPAHATAAHAALELEESPLSAESSAARSSATASLSVHASSSPSAARASSSSAPSSPSTNGMPAQGRSHKSALPSAIERTTGTSSGTVSLPPLVRQSERFIRSLDIQHKIWTAGVCPITRRVFSQPVVASDGVTYEKSALYRWFCDEGMVSPITRVPVSADVHPNHTLRRLLAVVLSTEQGSAIPMLDLLPPELLLMVIQRLPARAITALAQTSRHFYSSIQSDFVWESLLARDADPQLYEPMLCHHSPLEVYKQLCPKLDTNRLPRPPAPRGSGLVLSPSKR